MTRSDELLKAAIARIEAADRALAEELHGLKDALSAPRESPGPFFESTAWGQGVPGVDVSLETIVLRTGRPVLAVVHDAPRLDFADAASEVWRSRLTAATEPIRRAARAVGRVNVSGHSQLGWVGTGWLVAPGTVVTNRHVAREFARTSGGRFVFLQGPAGDEMAVSVDFLRELERDDRLEARILEVVHIEEDDGPDMAVLRIETGDSFEPPPPIQLATAGASVEQQIAVIGYPARDSRVPDQPLMYSIFGEVYDTKRLAPGQVTGVQPGILLHDCSTLGGNSGSVLLDLATGEAVGLHFAGRFLETNYAVPAAVVAERLDAVHRRITGGTRPPPQTAGGGESGTRPPPQTPPAPPRPGAPPVVEVFAEAVPEDYVGRRGYDREFLGVAVPLPVVTHTSDVLTFPWEGTEANELTYEHFSVVMSRSRRLCFLSAVNIDGTSPRRLKRPDWRLDPRIPAAQQIKQECYGAEPKFSRGHMTRREDPIWGEAEAAGLGNRDSMHVTNTVPQMQPFNGGIWLGLENYALEHTREDDMRITVFTGPFLLNDDPVRYGVKVPVSFWKVIAFIHDETGELCATGYTMSQQDFLREEEFVFGQHHTWQTAIRTIEARSGVRFGELASIDPLADVPEGPEALTPLTDFGAIVFRRRSRGEL